MSPALTVTSPSLSARKTPNVSPRQGPEFRNLLRGPARPPPMKPSPRRSNFKRTSGNEEDEEEEEDVEPVVPVRAPLGRLPILRAVPNHLAMGEQRLGGLASEFHEVYQPASLAEQEEGRWVSLTEKVPTRVLEDLVRSPVLPPNALGQIQEIVQILQLRQKTGLRDGACLSKVAAQRIRKLEDASGWRLHVNLAAILHAQKESPPLQQSCLDARYRLEMAQIQGVPWEDLHQLGPGVVAAERHLQDFELSQNRSLVDFEMEFAGRWASECIAFLEKKPPPLGLAKDAVALALKAFTQFPNTTQHFSMPRISLTSGAICTQDETWPTTGETGDSQLRAVSAGIVRRLNMTRDQYPTDFARVFLTTSFARRKICTALRVALESKTRYVIPETGEEWGPNILQEIFDKLDKVEESFSGFMAGCSFRMLYLPGIAIKMKKLHAKRTIRRHDAFENLQDVILSLVTSAKGQVSQADSVIEPLQKALRQALTLWVPVGQTRPLAVDGKHVPLQDAGMLVGVKAPQLTLDAGDAQLASLDLVKSLAKSDKHLPTLIEPLPIPRGYLEALNAEQNNTAIDNSHPEAYGTHGFIARNCLLFGSMQNASPGVEIAFVKDKEVEKDKDKVQTLFPEDIVLEDGLADQALVSTTAETVLGNLGGWSTAVIRFFFRTLGYASQIRDAMHGLKVVTPRPVHVQRLAFVGLGNLEALEEDLFLSCPQLKDLDLRNCENLRFLAGLEHALALETMNLAGCGALEYFSSPPVTEEKADFSLAEIGLKRPGSTVPAPALKFIDLHECTSLSVDQILQLVDRTKEQSGSSERQESVVQVMTEIGDLRKGDRAAIKAFFVDDTGDAVYELVGPLVERSKDELPPKTVSEIVPIKQEDVSFSRELVEESSRYLGVDSSILCVWPSPESGELNSSLSSEIRFAACQGIRAKLVRAIKAAKKASLTQHAECGRELLTTLSRFGVVPGPPDEQNKVKTTVAPGDKDVDDLFSFPKDPLIDYPTVRSVASRLCLPACKAVQLKHLSCSLCEHAVDIARWEAHETQECSGRACRCNCLGSKGMKVPQVGAASGWVPCGMPVKVTDMAHHQKVEQALQKALLTWSVDHMQQAIRDAKKKLGDAPTTLCKPQITAAQARLKEIHEKVQLVKPIIKRGNIDIDFERCTLQINKTIQFAPRKPPDTSAEIEEKAKEEADEIISDLAVVLTAFQARMIVEGHTGSTNPPDYWQALADNRAKLLVAMLAKKGVPKGVAIPRGEPGGGAKVLVYSAEEQED